MKMDRQMSLITSMIVFIVVLSLKSASAEVYNVGDEYGWAIPPNKTFYQDWANSKTFQINDEIRFNWTGTLSDYNVAEVTTLADYQNCTKPGITFDKVIDFVLTRNGSRFFLSTVDDQCENGMKLIVTVGSPTETAAWDTSASSISLPQLMTSFLAFITTLIISICFN